MQNEDKKNQREISGGLLVYWVIGLLVCWVIGLLAGYCGGEEEEEGEEAEEELN